MIFRNKTLLFRCKTLLFLETELSQVHNILAKVQYEQKRHSFEELCLFFIVDDRSLVLTGRRISVAAYAHFGRCVCSSRSGYMRTSVGIHVHLGRGTCVPRSGYDDHQVSLTRQRGFP